MKLKNCDNEVEKQAAYAEYQKQKEAASSIREAVNEFYVLNRNY